MAGTQEYINPAFPSSVYSNQTPPPGVRAELFTRTGATSLWTVPVGVYYAKVTVVGGSGGSTNPSTGNTVTFDTIATSTGGTFEDSCGCISTPGSFSVSTTRLLQNRGVNYASVNRYITNYGNAGNSNASGGQGIVYLENLVPGTMFRITIGAAITGGVAGCVLVEY